MAIALFPFKNPITEAPDASAVSQYRCARDPASNVLPRSGTPSASPNHGTPYPTPGEQARKWPSVVAWTRTYMVFAVPLRMG